MGNITKEAGLSHELRQKINGLDMARPYVWRLRLTEADFRALETSLVDVAAHGGGVSGALLTARWAMPTVVYLAEWYKRCYQGGETHCVIGFSTEQLKQLWQLSGLNQQTLLYRDETGKRRWLYSIYVLGGLAVRHELARPDSKRFMRALCRIYHGEDYTLENLDDAGRAASFRESIRRKHSLYDYMKELLSGRFDDTADDDLCSFIAAMKAANDEVLRQKFRLEWLVSYLPKDHVMRRSLRLWLCPEEVGGGLYQYLRYDRVHLWGVRQPDTQPRLRFAVGFYDDADNEVAAPDWEHPLITYSNTGSQESGFVSWGVERTVTLRHIPTTHFAKIVIWVKTDDGKTYVAGEEKTKDYMQLWQSDAMADLWSSRPNFQRATALIWSPACHLKIGPAAQGQVHLATFADGENIGEQWGWFYIYDSVTLIDGQQKEHSFYNRIGYDQVYTRRYESLIAYIDGGLIRHCYEDEDGEDDELLPLIYSRHDVLVRHFDTKDAITDVRVSQEGEAEQVEWKQTNGLYAPWTDTAQPPYGRIALRITIKGQQRTMSVAFLPKLKGTMPLMRDCGLNEIHYAAMDGSTATVEDDIRQDGIPLEPTYNIKIGVSDDYYVLPIFRPVSQSEICIGGKVVNYQGCSPTLPYILKQEAEVRIFNEDGFRSYDCSRLSGLYPMIKAESGMSVYDFWHDGYGIEATLLEATAPESLSLTLGSDMETEVSGDMEFYKWDYDKNSGPVTADYSETPERNTIIFQSMEHLSPELTLMPAKRNFFAFKYKTVVAKKMNLLNCFEIASRHRLYFFILEPIVNQKDKSVWRTDVFEPLMEKRNGHLTQADVLALNRLAEEMLFDWSELGVEIKL